jgi:hypothetical protein
VLSAEARARLAALLTADSAMAASGDSKLSETQGKPACDAEGSKVT